VVGWRGVEQYTGLVLRRHTLLRCRTIGHNKEVIVASRAIISLQMVLTTYHFLSFYPYYWLAVQLDRHVHWRKSIMHYIYGHTLA
jgi:hypothetical protein